MKLATRLTNLGIEISLHEGDGPRPLEPATDADQKNPRRNYVYAHMNNAARIFYVGKGQGKRAWSTDRHPLWRRYVEKQLNGDYQVRILQDNLSTKGAEEAEAAWIAQCSDTLVNWVNMGRATDFQALDQYHKLRDANRTLIQEAKALENSNQEEAVAMYVQAIEAIRTYAFISYEKGLVGRLLDEETAEIGRSGEIEALDRLTLCLIRLGKSIEAVQHVDQYFALYRLDLRLRTSARIARRIKKAVQRMQSGETAMIEEGLPEVWRQLQDQTAQLLTESGFEARTDTEITLARGTVSVDVFARDPSATPPTIYICECKHWQGAVSKNAVHAFRTVVIDAGAHRGFLISSGGFQSGAYEAAQHSNVELVNWVEFQQLFLERWFRTFMAPTLLKEGDALHEYTEPINSRIARKAAALPSNRQDQFRRLQERYAVPSFILLMLWYDPFTRKLKVPLLPLRSSLGPRAPIDLPADMLNATALRPLMNVVTQFYRHVTAEFDEVFGGRA